MSLFSVGQRVITPRGPGRVAAVRMGGDDYRTAVGVYVFLDTDLLSAADDDGALFSLSDVITGEKTQMTETAREMLAEAERERPTLALIFVALKALVEDVDQLIEQVERQEARLKELENWRTS